MAPLTGYMRSPFGGRPPYIPRQSAGRTWWNNRNRPKSGVDQESLFGTSRKAAQKPFMDIYKGAVGQNQGITDQMMALLASLQGTLGANLGGQAGTIDEQQKLLGQFSEQGEADIGQRYKNLQSQGQQNLVSRGLAGSTILPTLNASVTRQKGAELNRFRDQVLGRNLQFQDTKRGFLGGAYGLQQGLIQQVLNALQTGRQPIPGSSLGTMPQEGIPGALSGLIPLLGQLFGQGGFGSGFGNNYTNLGDVGTGRPQPSPFGTRPGSRPIGKFSLYNPRRRLGF